MSVYENVTRWNNSPTVKRVVVWVGVALIFTLSMGVCFGNGEADATEPSWEDEQAASQQALVDTSSVHTATSASSYSTATRKCWRWTLGPWEWRDFWGNLRFGYGEDIVACTNAAATKWVALPLHDPYHYVGFWQHDQTTKSRSALQYSFLNVNAFWKFSFRPVGFPILHADRSLRCELRASNHTATCVRRGHPGERLA
jgi:hypothetical protein